MTLLSTGDMELGCTEKIHLAVTPSDLVSLLLHGLKGCHRNGHTQCMMKSTVCWYRILGQCLNRGESWFPVTQRVAAMQHSEQCALQIVNTMAARVGHPTAKSSVPSESFPPP